MNILLRHSTSAAIVIARSPLWLLAMTFLLAIMLLPLRPLFATEPPPTVAEKTPVQAAQRLSALGLSRRGQIWVSPLEVELEERCARLDRLRKDYGAAQEQVARLAAERREWREQIEQAENQRKLLSATAADPELPENRRRAIQTEIQNLQRAIDKMKMRLEELLPDGEDVPLRQALVARAAVYREVVGTILAIERTDGDRLAASYAPWTKEPEEARALLAALVPPGRLGPRHAYFTPFREEAAKLAREVFAAGVPLASPTAPFELICFAAERLAVPAVLRGDRDYTLLPFDIADAAGIRIDDETPRITLYQGKRTISVAKAKLAELRIGDVVAKDVEVWIVPAEESTLGAQIGANALAGYRPIVEPRQFLLRLESTRTSPVYLSPGERATPK